MKTDQEEKEIRNNIVNNIFTLSSNEWKNKDEIILQNSINKKQTDSADYFGKATRPTKGFWYDRWVF